MSKSGSGIVEARRQAQALLSKKNETERVSERDRARKAEAEKTAKLRALRLAKEAAEAAEKEQAKSRFVGARRGAAVRK